MHPMPVLDKNPVQWHMDTHLCIHMLACPMSSKDVGIRIRLERELRDAFQGACVAENRNASDVLREFMRSFAEHSGGGKQPSLFTSSISVQPMRGEATSDQPPVKGKSKRT